MGSLKEGLQPFSSDGCYLHLSVHYSEGEGFVKGSNVKVQRETVA